MPVGNICSPQITDKLLRPNSNCLVAYGIESDQIHTKGLHEILRVTLHDGPKDEQHASDCDSYSAFHKFLLGENEKPA